MFSTNSSYVLPGTSKENGKFTEAVCIYSNNHHCMWITSFWDKDDEKHCNCVFRECEPWLQEVLCVIPSSSSAVSPAVQMSVRSNERESTSRWPDQNPAKASANTLHHPDWKDFGDGWQERLWLTEHHYRHSAEAPRGSRRGHWAVRGPGIIHCSFEKVSHSADQ